MPVHVSMLLNSVGLASTLSQVDNFMAFGAHVGATSANIDALLLSAVRHHLANQH